MSRTYKREYTGSARHDSSCRSHGGCPWCEGNKLFHRNGRDEFMPSKTLTVNQARVLMATLKQTKDES